MLRETDKAHHIWVIGIDTHICEWIETGHEPIPHVTVQLSEWVMYILAGLHAR
jgi:hypothetical protein